MSSATIREWLNQNYFDWDTGKIIYQDVGKKEGSPGWASPKSSCYIEFSHEVLDKKFSTGYGSPKCPRFIAKDKDAIYFPGQYDGTTFLIKIEMDMDHYLDFKNLETPYPGG